MSKFNTESIGTKTTNLAGGTAFSTSPKVDFVSLLLTSFVEDQFYQTANDSLTKLKSLIKTIDDKEFVGKALIYARQEFGMRSISHAGIVELLQTVKGETWTKDTVYNVIRRVDDITEILSYQISNYKKPLPNALKKGLAKAFSKFDEYQLAKYRAENKTVKLVDAVNMVHPSPVQKNAEALKKLVDGTLRSIDTWESELTKAGQEATTDEEKEELKADVWNKLISSRKIGYFALLRNLRNVIEQAPYLTDIACEMLIDRVLIKKSLVLPFRYLTAINEIGKLQQSEARKVLVALNKAIDISCDNVPLFDGDTLVVVDYSGSMGTDIDSYRGKGTLFGTLMAKANNADIMIFGNDAAYIPYNPTDSVLTITEKIMQNNTGNGWSSTSSQGVQVGHGTNFSSIFSRINKKYNRIIIFSDMQGWGGFYSPHVMFNKYKQSTNPNVLLYSFDLAGYGSLQFPERNVYTIAGFSEKIFNVMELLEKDKNALITEIENYEVK